MPSFPLLSPANLPSIPNKIIFSHLFIPTSPTPPPTSSHHVLLSRRTQGEPLYTYTIITVEAHDGLAHIHHRMPAILDGDEAIKTWLDPDLASEEAIKMLHPSPTLTWYRVSDTVNNVRNSTPECILKIDPRYSTCTNT